MSVLQNIIETKREEVQQLKRKYMPASFTHMELFSRETIKLKNRDERLSIIAEIKKASPSRGVIRENFNHLKIAETYQGADVDAISILTDEKYFSGKINYLYEIAELKKVPLLRKDFIIDELQVFESKAYGADIILLISEVLSAVQIKDLTQAALEIGLEVLLELHSAKQLDKIDFDLNKMIGINNRNLEAFATSLRTTIELSNQIPGDCQIISESGISTEYDISVIKNTSVMGILVGEFLMSSKNIEQDLSRLKGWCRRES